MHFINTIVLGLVVNTIKIPFDNGANIKGSSKAPEKIFEKLHFLNIENDYTINANKHMISVFGDGFLKCWNTLNSNKFPITIGGDHTVAISSIYASNEFTRMNRQTLGVLWCDAHADFNTMETSESKNIHGMPVAILCGDTLPILSNGQSLDYYQFGFYGLRDLDSLEFYRFQENNMKIIDSDTEFDAWVNLFDKIHISFDINCLDPTVFSSVNTPVKNGKSVSDLKNIFKKVKNTGKLMSMDIVEYNPEIDDNIDVIIDILKTLF